MKRCFEDSEITGYSIKKLLRERYVFELLAVKAGEMVVDMGSGGGFFSNILAKHGANVVSLDVEFSNLLSSRRNYGNRNISYIVADVTRLPFKGEIFDKALCSEVLEHVSEEHIVIGEIWRTLKSEGILVITTPCTNPTLSTDKIKRFFRIDEEAHYGHIRSGYDSNRLVGLLMKGRFEILQICYSIRFLAELMYIGIFLIRKLIVADTDKWGGADLLDLKGKKIFLPIDSYSQYYYLLQRLMK